MELSPLCVVASENRDNRSEVGDGDAQNVHRQLYLAGGDPLNLPYPWIMRNNIRVIGS